jgi:hypothetical protein
MADPEIGEEIRDIAGSSAHYNGTVGTSPVSIPSVANKVISEFCIANTDSTKTAVLSVSLDAGTTFKTIGYKGSWTWSPKGRIKQIQIKADAASRAYQIAMNFEEF